MKKLIVVWIALAGCSSLYGQTRENEEHYATVHLTNGDQSVRVASKTDSLLASFIVLKDSITYALDLEKNRALGLGIPEKDYDEASAQIEKLNEQIRKALQEGKGVLTGDGKRSYHIEGKQ